MLGNYALSPQALVQCTCCAIPKKEIGTSVLVRFLRGLGALEENRSHKLGQLSLFVDEQKLDKVLLLSEMGVSCHAKQANDCYIQRI
eukprot:4482667-Amphidinium_carterae.1